MSMSIMPPPRSRELADRVDVGLRVDPQQLLGGRRRRLDPLEAEPVLALQRRLDRAQPAGVLGVGAGVVLERERMVDVERHARRLR